DKTVFLEKLYQFMNDNQSPISKNPILGFKEVDLHQFYVSTHKRGGYDQVTKKKLWKEIYMELGGSACNTSAATGTRKNYEK
ncbi:hypothetical protein HELRODRAFT_62031, partial [Helobdella robusta]|uniref:ARID domain-containing protein n=1 Tax=Helobdella robusta TaxID=6412 RepID=T1FWU4_HELRO